MSPRGQAAALLRGWPLPAHSRRPHSRRPHSRQSGKGCWAPQWTGDGQRGPRCWSFLQMGNAGQRGGERAEPALPGGGGGGAGPPRPYGVTARARLWAAAVGKAAPAVPEGGARSLWMAPVVCLRAVTQHDLAAPPQCGCQAWSRPGRQSPQRGPHPPARAPSVSHLLALTSRVACTGRTGVWWAAQGPTAHSFSAPSPAGPGVTTGQTGGQGSTRTAPREGPWIRDQAASPPLPPDCLGCLVGRGGQGDRRPLKEAGRRVLPGISPAPAPPRPPSGGNPTHPALPGPGSRCWMWSHEAIGKASSQCRKPRGKRACGGRGAPPLTWAHPEAPGARGCHLPTHPQEPCHPGHWPGSSRRGQE